MFRCLSSARCVCKELHLDAGRSDVCAISLALPVSCDSARVLFLMVYLCRICPEDVNASLDVHIPGLNFAFHL